VSISNLRLIISGFALLLFGIVIALVDKSSFSYLSGGLGLFLVIVSCSVKDEKDEK